MERHRQQGDRDLLPRGKQHIHFPLTGAIANGIGQLHQAIRGFAHGRDHHHYLMSRCHSCLDSAGYRLNALDTTDGRAAILLYNQSHGRSKENAVLFYI